eukprot:Skav236242  [mRNA]  locus=scaffold829:291628:296460:- [translate_table: standard]
MVGTFDDTRITSCLVQLEHHVFHLVEIYGYPACHPGAKHATNLLVQIAADLIAQVNLPAIIGGDFNHDPMQLPSVQALHQCGYVTAAQWYEQHTQLPFPATCKDVTSPDQFILHPRVLPFVHGISVDKAKAYHDHDPVILTLRLPAMRPARQTCRMPQSWIDFHPNPDIFAQLYQATLPTLPDAVDVTTALRRWSHHCEEVVSRTVKQQHNDDPLKHPTSKLPSRCFGRSRTPKLVRQPIVNCIRSACHGQYNPVIESASMKLKHLTRQVRRLQSYERCLSKRIVQGSFPLVNPQLEAEWTAITQAPGFSQGFPCWCANQPELAHFPYQHPSCDFLVTAIGLLKHETDDRAFHERKLLAAHSKFSRHYDSKEGGLRVISKKVRGPSMPLLHSVEHPVSIPYTLVFRSHGLIRLRLHDDTPVCLHIATHCSSVPITPFHQQGNELDAFVIDDDQLIADTGQLEQTRTTQQPQQVARALHTFWSRFWNRDLPDEPMSAEFSSYLEQTPQLPALDRVVDDPEHWRKAIMDTKSTSARGLDGWFVDELKQLPAAAYAQLASLFTRATGNGFSHDDMTIITLPIGKTESPTGPSQVRPISLLSMLYRVWAKVTTRQLLRHLAGTLPAAIVGYIPGRCLLTRMLSQQHVIEKAILRDSDSPPWLGVTLDIVKCFNAIHRRAAAQAMLKLGIPPFWVWFWYRSVSCSTRYWKVDNQLFYGQGTTTGAAEGDSWSILACIGLSYVWCYHMDMLNTSCLIFADNWSWKTQALASHRQALQFTDHFTGSVKLTIDWDKTWQWHSPCKQHNALRRALSQLHPNMEIHTLQVARELGFTMQYVGLQSRATQRTRHDLAIRRIKRIRAQSASLQTKAQLCFHALTQALHATETYALGQQWINDLRSAISRTLSPGRRNTNPFLALTLLSKHVPDPQMYVIHQSVRASRALLWHMSHSDQQAFFDIAATDQALATRVKGPAGALSFNLAKLGCTVTRQGEVLTPGMPTFHMLYSSLPDLRLFLDKLWMKHVVEDCLDRPGYSHLPIPAFRATQHLLAKQDPTSQLTLSYTLTAAHMLANQAVHFAAAEDACRFCDQEDSQSHRLLSCPALALLGPNHPVAVDHLHEHDPCHLMLPVLYEDPHWDIHWWFCNSFPEPDFVPDTQQYVERLLADNLTPWFYTDGSCSQPQCPAFPCAAFAVVVHGPVELPAQEAIVEQFRQLHTIPSSFQVLTLGPCFGKQTVPRSELLAVLQVVELDCQAIIYTDSQYVLDIAAQLGQCLHPRFFQHQANFDLLRRFWTALQSGTVQLRKVKAHAAQQAASVEETFHRLGNEAADQSAKLALSQHPMRPQFQLLQQERNDQVAALSAQWQYRIQLYKERTVLLNNHVEIHDRPATQQSWQQQLQNLSTLVVDPYHTVDVPPLTDERYNQCLYGTQHSQALMTWWAMIRWPTAPPHKDDPGVTWLELAVSYMLVTQQAMVINTANSGAHFRAKQLALNPAGVKFTQQTFNMERALSQLHRLLRLTWPGARTKHCRSVRLMGNQHGKPGLLPRPQFPLQQETVQLLSHVFQQPDADVNSLIIPSRDPQFVIDPSSCDADDWSQDWLPRVTRFRGARRSRRSVQDADV